MVTAGPRGANATANSTPARDSSSMREFVSQELISRFMATPALKLAGIAAVLLAFCLLVQAVSGTWSAGFVIYPDEPSHFVGSAMVRDWLVSGEWRTPREFAQNYYAHYPFFALGYWPPLFSFVTGCWMLLAGVGRQQALVVPAVFAAGTAFLIFWLIRKRAGYGIGLCAGLLYLSLPAARLWMCAVMVDHMTAFLCLLAVCVLLRYLKNPSLINGVLLGVVSALAILSKYSAAYLVVLPMASVLLLRRFDMLKKLSFWVAPAVIGLTTGPWLLWTRNMAAIGLPSSREPLGAHRLFTFLADSFALFPPVLLVMVATGLLLLAVRPKAWSDDVAVLAMLFAGHLALLVLSPVEPEHRYLLAPAAALLIGAVAGWSETLAGFSSLRAWKRAVSPFAVLATLIFAIGQVSGGQKMPADQVNSAVQFVVKDPRWTGQRIVVPPDLEGPVIADFVAQTRRRPAHYLIRPLKTLARTDWFAHSYSPLFRTSREMMEYFRQHPVTLIIWNEVSNPNQRLHSVLMGEMLRDNPLSWRKVFPLDTGRGAHPNWAIYEYTAPSLSRN